MADPHFSLASNLGFPAPRILAETVRQWEPDPSEFIFSSELPTEAYPVEQIEWDEEDPITGLIGPTALDTDPVLRKPQGRKHRMQLTAYWAESWRLRQSDFHRIRAAGAFDKLSGQDKVMEETRVTDLRLESRIEWCRVQALKGSLVINGNGVNRTITYNLPDGHTPTASALWNSLESADPVSNIIAWSQLFRGVGRGVRCYYNQTVANLLARNTKLVDLFKQSPMVGELSPSNVGKLLSLLTAGSQPIEFIPYDEGYKADNGDYTPFLTDEDFLMVCNPPKGQKLGAFKTTPDIRNGAGSMQPRPGKWVVVDNKLASKTPFYEQTQGINGIPIIKFPACRIRAKVT